MGLEPPSPAVGSAAACRLDWTADWIELLEGGIVRVGPIVWLMYAVFEWIDSFVLKIDWNWLAARNWPCAMTCTFCDQELETAMDICLHCSYAKEVWMMVSNLLKKHMFDVCYLPKKLTACPHNWWMKGWLIAILIIIRRIQTTHKLENSHIEVDNVIR